MSLPKGLTPISTENAREIVDAIDSLILSHINSHALTSAGHCTASQYRAAEEERELLKRRITDYLLVTDPRDGDFQTGKRDQ